MATVRETTYDLLRALGMTVVFGNPGSTEEAFLAHFPSDFTYVLALQEASVIGIADGYAQATGKPALVNVHTAAGTGNGMGNLATAWHNKTPLIVTAGQQTRDMVLMEPMLTNLRAPLLPQPYVKWSYEPVRAVDVPEVLMRAYAEAVQPPAGPVYLSLPMDDWEQTAEGPAMVRSPSTRVAPDPDRLRQFSDALTASRNPLLVIGAGVDRSGGWDAAVALAEKLRAPVWAPPMSERVAFPENHPQYQGILPPAIGPLSEKLQGHDLALVIGAPVFRYYPYIPGPYLPPGTRLLHITDDPGEAARAPVGDSLIGDAGLACAALAAMIPTANRPLPAPRPAPPPPQSGIPLAPEELFAALAREWPEDGILVDETASSGPILRRYLPIKRPASSFRTASGILGFALPAAVGIALGERHAGRSRPVIAVIGDGAFHYSVQALWTAAQHRLPVVFVVPVNEEYAILKAFAKLENNPGVPGLDLPGLDIPAISRGYGCAAERVDTADAFAEALRAALQADGPTVLAVPITKTVPALL